MTSSSSSSTSSGSSGTPFLFPPAGYYLDNEGRMWRISSSSSNSSQSSSSSSMSSSKSSSSQSSSSSSDSSSSESSSSSNSSESSSRSSESSSSSSESSDSSSSSSSSNSSSSESSSSSSVSSLSSSSVSSSSSSKDGIFHYPPDGYLMDQDGRQWKEGSSLSSESNSSYSSYSSSSSAPEMAFDDITDEEVEKFIKDLSGGKNTTNDSDNDTDRLSTNDIDVTSNDIDDTILESSCSIVVRNEDNVFKILQDKKLLHTFNNISEKYMFSLCGYLHSVTFASYGSFIFNVGVNVENTQEHTSSDSMLNLNNGDVITLTKSRNNIRFTGKTGEEAKIIFDPARVTKETTEVVDCGPAHGCLTSNDSIRRFVLDRMIDDNVIDLELYFTEEEINHARYLAVANWNEIPPYVGSISLTTCHECLPYPTIFVNGISYYLYLSKVQKIQKEDLDYNAGGMQVDLNKRRIAHLTSNIKFFKEEFVSLAAARKTHINYQGAWGQIG